MVLSNVSVDIEAHPVYLPPNSQLNQCLRIEACWVGSARGKLQQVLEIISVVVPMTADQFSVVYVRWSVH